MDIVKRAKKLGLHGCDLHQIFDRVEELQQQLLECQAHEKVLLDALENFGEHSSDCESGYEKRIAEGYARMTTGKSCTCGFSSAINQPSDDTALNAYVEALPEMKLLDEIGVLLEDVEYKGSYVEGIKTLLEAEFNRGYERGCSVTKAEEMFHALGD